MEILKDCLHSFWYIKTNLGEKLFPSKFGRVTKCVWVFSVKRETELRRYWLTVLNIYINGQKNVVISTGFGWLDGMRLLLWIPVESKHEPSSLWLNYNCTRKCVKTWRYRGFPHDTIPERGGIRPYTTENYIYLQVSSGMTQSRRHPSVQHLDCPEHWSSVWHSSSGWPGGHLEGSLWLVMVGHLPVLKKTSPMENRFPKFLLLFIWTEITVLCFKKKRDSAGRSKSSHGLRNWPIQ